MPRATRMTAYLVGAGPGDKGLMTARSLELIARADVILYDKLIPDGALDGARADAELVDVGKIGGAQQVPQETTNELLLRHARAGREVVRLKGGDPFVFGRGGEEAQLLRAAGLDFEVVPGVTAGVAAPAYAGIPVTQRGVSAAVAFVTGHEDPAKPDTLIDWPALAAFPGTLVFYMGVRSLDRIAAQLVAGGRPPSQPVAVVQRGTFADQRTVSGTLADIAARRRRGGRAGAGDHGRRRRRRAARRDRMVRGRTVGRPQRRGDPRARPGEPARGAAARARRERRRGARDPHRAARRDAARPRRLRPALRHEPQRRAPAARALPRRARPARAPRSPRSARAPPTRCARAASRPTSCPRAPSPSRSSRRSPTGPCAARSSPAPSRRATSCPTRCASAAPRSRSSPLYATVAEPLDDDARAAALGADYVTFTSASAVRFFVEAAGRPDGPRIVSIGPITSDALREHGLEPRRRGDRAHARRPRRGAARSRRARR